MGRNSHEVRFFILVVTPSKEKGTKNALETGRTFATIFADMDFRQRLLDVHGEPEFKGILLKHAQDLASEQSNPTRRLGNHEPDLEFELYRLLTRIPFRDCYQIIETLFKERLSTGCLTAKKRNRDVDLLKVFAKTYGGECPTILVIILTL
ncbi:unnamed protein product, partial [Medioppia subpectinata]